MVKIDGVSEVDVIMSFTDHNSFMTMKKYIALNEKVARRMLRG